MIWSLLIVQNLGRFLIIRLKINNSMPFKEGLVLGFREHKLFYE